MIFWTRLSWNDKTCSAIQPAKASTVKNLVCSTLLKMNRVRAWISGRSWSTWVEGLIEIFRSIETFCLSKRSWSSSPMMMKAWIPSMEMIWSRGSRSAWKDGGWWMRIETEWANRMAWGRWMESENSKGAFGFESYKVREMRFEIERARSWIEWNDWFGRSRWSRIDWDRWEYEIVSGLSWSDSIELENPEDEMRLRSRWAG